MDQIKRAKISILLGCSITVLIAILMLIKFHPTEMLKEKLLDYNFKLRGTVQPPDNIVIAAIDEKSIDELGRWPWNRDKIARLVDKLAGAGAEIIVFDIILSESEKNDAMLGSAIKNAGNVILPIVFDFHKEAPFVENEFLTNSAFASILNHEKFNKYTPITAKRILMPVPKLIREAMILGHINMFPDTDGTLRWESLALEYNGYLYPSVTLQAAAKYMGIPQEKAALDATEGVLLGKRYIPTDNWGRTIINYYGPTLTFKHISISDILKDRVEPGLLQGKIVLIGATAIGIYDLRVTPFSAAMPGIEKHASMIASILDNKFIRQASFAVDLTFLLVSGLLCALIVSRFSAAISAAATALLLAVVLFTGYYVFAHHGYWLTASYPALAVFSIFAGVTAYHYAVEEKYARKVRAMFSSYVTEKLVNQLIANPDMAKLGGERREVTVLFSDIRGFTSLSEKHTPEEVVSILNEYLSVMTNVVFKWDGVLDKFIGDAIVAFWGAPMKQENHAELAVRCALHMKMELEKLQNKWKAEGKIMLDNGIGINTGEVIVGNIGAEGRKMDYTVIGDHVNLGARVEGLTRKYNAGILITGFTLHKTAALIESGEIGHVSVLGLERVVVKGKEQPVEIYELKSIDEKSRSILKKVADDKVVHLTEK